MKQGMIMRHCMIQIISFLLAFPVFFTGLVWADAPHPADDKTLTQDVADLKKKINLIEQKIGPDGKSDTNAIQCCLSGLYVTGGISAGSFYTSNPGKDISDNEFLLSNFLVELSSTDKSRPVSFTGALGKKPSTPTLLSTPANNNNFDVEYASLSVAPLSGMMLVVGLLQPNAGFENTYTFKNNNIMLGATASQQPYNAYGVRLGYEISGLNLCAGYYKKRLDDQGEYNENGILPSDSWEVGINGSIWDHKLSLYHYHLEGRRNLTGASVEKCFKNIDFALNVDYWHRDITMADYYGDNSAMGGAFYVTPMFGRFSIPIRLEYIDQGESRIYIDNAVAKRIYTATISPTYKFSENTYIRAESAYANADNAFEDKNGASKNSRITLSAEAGYLF